jgi:hypothetical protein
MDISTRGLDVLFIAGFGPVPRNVGDSKALYQETLGLPIKPMAGNEDYLLAEHGALDGANILRSGRCTRRHSPALAQQYGLLIFRRRKAGLSSKSPISTVQPVSCATKVTPCSWKTVLSPGAEHHSLSQPGRHAGWLKYYAVAP